ncbi:hypothetical protein FNE59_07595 [Bacillus thuringiensis]|uniref:hypothetical protein n=1 Tax=Bacillus cereus group TaxID=86661 RepID=UPI001298B17E|nr:hypothetical protein [Bacillus thuringiensis]MEB8858860.1 hypothetical protein [Bacillus cereus]MDR5045548.1 hypothetical protein [Bacillus thuringiensis]MEB9418317.1 hypothetical protein [Bacillus cereus]MEC2464205.1 hypothetical protein [Bacillus cereus]MRC86594.1 hypothetical protein [Bacillus thuringiensis]
MDNPNKNKTCFIITPIGDDQSDIRRAADGVIDAVITPELLKIGFSEENIKVAHRMANPGSINQQVIECILESDLAIANLTTLNPNVMYELAIRHAVRKPVIQLIQKGTKKLPFDIIEERTIFYEDDMSGVMELSKDLGAMLPFALEDKEPDNPIYRVAKQKEIMKKITTNEEPMQYIIEQMNSIQSQVSKLAPLVNNNKNKYIRNGVVIDGGARQQMFRFSVDDAVISHSEVMGKLKEFKENNRDMEVTYSISGNVLTVVGSGYRTIMLDTLLKYVLNINGVQLLSTSKVLFDALV